jgi:hypothetical protein
MAGGRTLAILLSAGLVGLLALTGCGEESQQPATTAPHPSAKVAIGQPACSMSPNPASVTVPLHVASRAGAPNAVDVCVGGRGPYRFLLDTGSAGTLISSELVGRLALPRAGPPVPFGGEGCHGTTRPVRLPDLSVGGHSIPAGVGYTIHANGFGGPGQPEGTLGAGALRRLGPLLLDYHHGSLSLGPTRTEGSARSAGTDLPAAWTKHHAAIIAPMAILRRAGGITLRTVISFRGGTLQPWLPDTGSQWSIIDGTLVRASHLRYLRGTKMQPSLCSSTPLSTRRAWSGHWQLADHPLRPQSLEVSSVLSTAGVDGVIGSKTLAEYGSVIFDWAGRKLLLGVG